MCLDRNRTATLLTGKALMHYWLSHHIDGRGTGRTELEVLRRSLMLKCACFVEITISSKQTHDLVSVWYDHLILYSRGDMDQRSCLTLRCFLMARLFPLLATLASNFIRQSLSPPVCQFQTCVYIFLRPLCNPFTLNRIPVIILRKA